MSETVFRIEPTRLEKVSDEVANLAAELSALSSRLGISLHPATARHLADLIRMMNTYYSNLIEGHYTRPRDIERALKGDLDQEKEKRNLQLEAVSHVRVQAKIDQMAAENTLPEPASREFIRWLHREFYSDAPEDFLLIEGVHGKFLMTPGEWRQQVQHDVAVGRLIPPSSHSIEEFMAYFEKVFRFERMGKAEQIMAMAVAHHRFNYIHPFPDGNGRVSRLMTHAMALKAGIGAHGLWSVSRGLARGLKSRSEYKQMMEMADTPRQGDLDGRGNLSHRELEKFTQWFLQVCLDQVQFMTHLFDFNNLRERLKHYVQQSPDIRFEAVYLLEEAALRGEFERGEVARIAGLSDRTARRLLKNLIEKGLLNSETPKGPVSLRFPEHTLEQLFPKLFPVI